VAYFHLRYVTSAGISDTAHFTIRVDTTAPDQVIAEVVRNEKNERVIVMSAQDALSGVDSFDVVFNNDLQARILASNGKATYAIPRGLEIGTYDIVITAYDKARNKKTVSLPLVLDEYEPPVLTVTQKTVYQGMNMVVKGDYAVPGKELLVYIKNPNGLLEQYLVTPDENGMFTIKVKTWNHPGMYEMWSESLTAQKNSFATSKRLTYYVRKNIGIDIIKVSVVVLPFIIIGNGLVYFFLARRIPKKVIKKKRLEVTD
jgi:hypothetical protein